MAPGIKQEMGPHCCLPVSAALSSLLARFGYESRVLAVTALFCDVRHKAALFQSTVDEGGRPDVLQRRFHVYALGAYGDDVEPRAGGTRLPGLTVAAHAVVLIDQPRLLVDVTADQLNAMGAGLPDHLLLWPPRSFPATERRLVTDAPPRHLAIYDWCEDDQAALPSDAALTERHVDGMEAHLRTHLGA